VLQCVTVCCSLLQFVAVWSMATWSIAASVDLKCMCVTVRCSVLQCVSVCFKKNDFFSQDRVHKYMFDE